MCSMLPSSSVSLRVQGGCFYDVVFVAVAVVVLLRMTYFNFWMLDDQNERSRYCYCCYCPAVVTSSVDLAGLCSNVTIVLRTLSSFMCRAFFCHLKSQVPRQPPTSSPKNQNQKRKNHFTFIEIKSKKRPC